MNNKIDFATIRSQFPQEWPRYSVGLIAVVGLRNGFTFLWRARIWASSLDDMDQGSLAALNEIGASPMMVLRMKQGFVGGLATYILYANSMALRGALRKDPRNIRTAFRMWLVPQVLFHIPVMLFYMKIGNRIELTDREIVEYFGSLIMMALDGWSMFVYMRDLKGQRRSSYGFLVEDGGEDDSKKEADD